MWFCLSALVWVFLFDFSSHVCNHRVFTFAEFFLDFFMSWIPLFFETKILFLCWLVHSNFSGAKFVYENFVDEVFLKHEVDIDHSLAVCKAQVVFFGTLFVFVLGE